MVSILTNSPGFAGTVPIFSHLSCDFCVSGCVPESGPFIIVYSPSLSSLHIASHIWWGMFIFSGPVSSCADNNGEGSWGMTEAGSVPAGMLGYVICEQT